MSKLAHSNQKTMDEIEHRAHEDEKRGVRTDPPDRVMGYEDAKKYCHVRSSIYRRSRPGQRYPKNHTIPFDERVPLEDQKATDWMEHDPREDHFEAYA